MRLRIFAVLAVATFAAACQTVQTTQPGAVGVERKQLMLVSEEQIEEGAAEAYRQVIEQARERQALNTDREAYQRVRKITQRLIPHTAVFRPDATEWDWQVNVETSDQVNAFAMPGGRIMVYTGLIDRLNATDAELATVIGHEIAHALREHTRERVSRAYAQELALAGIALATGAGENTMAIASQVSSVTFTLPHSREQEAEADRIGVELMARAGFDPNAALSLWRKMSEVGGGGPPEFLSTHPSGESRIQDLEASIPRVMPLYRKANQQRASP